MPAQIWFWPVMHQNEAIWVKLMHCMQISLISRSNWRTWLVSSIPHSSHLRISSWYFCLMVKFNVLTYVSSSHHAFKMNLCTRQWFILAALCALPRPWGQRHDLVLAIARPCPMRGSRFAQWNTFRPRRLDGGRRLAGGSGDVFVTHKMNLKDSFL